MDGIDEVLSGFLNCFTLRERTRHILRLGQPPLAVLYKNGLIFHWVTPLAADTVQLVSNWCQALSCDFID